MTLAGTIVPLPLASCLEDGDWGVECSSIFQEVFKLLGGVQPGKSTPNPSPKEITQDAFPTVVPENPSVK